ncbi:MAG TPA: kelch repeat-containing protein, partial [Myxococcota bacterium]
ADVDTTRPAPPRVDVDGVLVFERAPWGRLDAARRDVYRVSANATAVDAGNVVIVARDERGDAELARVRADDTGAFVASGSDGSLPTGDIDTVYVTAFDDAGNASDTAAVRDVRWYVTPVDKVVGDVVRNPHRFEVAPRFVPWRDAGGISEAGGDDFGAGDDDDVLDTVGAGSWRQVPDEDPAVLVGGAVDATWAHDPIRGISLVLGGTSTVFEAQPFPRLRCETYEAHAFRRGGDDRWAVVNGAPTQRVALVWVPPLEKIVAVGGNGALFTFDGAGFSELCSSVFGATPCDVEGDREQFGRPLRSNVVWDAARSVIVGSLGSSAFEIAFPATGRPVLRQTDTPLSTTAALAFHDRLATVVVYDGASLFALDDDGLTPLCADDDDDCVPPPAREGAQLAYDRRHDQLLLFGGGVQCDSLTPTLVLGPDPVVPPGAPRELWAFDGATWTDITPPGPPSSTPRGREGHAFGWDERRQRIVLVGGDDCDCASDPPETLFGVDIPPLNYSGGVDGDTWEWDGAAWTRVAVRTAPAGFTRAVPGGVRDHVLVAAPGHDGVVAITDDTVRLFHDDVWYRGGAARTHTFSPAWTTTPTGDLVGFGGGERQFGNSFGEPLVVVQGPPDPAFTIGAGAASANAQCEAFVDEACLPAFNQRFGSVAFHDGERLHVIGGSGGVGIGDDALSDATDQQISYSPAEGWREQCAGTSCGVKPSRRALARGVVDGGGDLVLFGGIVDGGTSDETWRFDGSTWTRLDGSVRPPARYGHAMGFDVARDAVVVAFGAANRGGVVLA